MLWWKQPVKGWWPGSGKEVEWPRLHTGWRHLGNPAQMPEHLTCWGWMKAHAGKCFYVILIPSYMGLSQLWAGGSWWLPGGVGLPREGIRAQVPRSVVFPRVGMCISAVFANCDFCLCIILGISICQFITISCKKHLSMPSFQHLFCGLCGIIFCERRFAPCQKGVSFLLVFLLQPWMLKEALWLRLAH